MSIFVVCFAKAAAPIRSTPFVMILKSISIVNFKNIREARLEFSPNVNCLLGNNGMGKSNLLDAIYFMSFCKSFSGMTDAQLITKGEDFTMIQTTYDRRGDDESLNMGITRGKRKAMKRNGKEYVRLSQHIGKFPLVMSSPNDIDLIRESGETRRRWIDMSLSQADAVYLDHLIRYNRALEQRNALLRNGVADANLFDALDIQLDTAAAYISKARAQWIERLSPIFNRYYRLVAGDDENAALAYSSSLLTMPMRDLLLRERHHDEIVKHTSVGIHRDDVEMTLDGMQMRRAGSQGQCKTFVIALRLAQYEFLSQATQMSPLLLLDDIFDKLDSNRVAKIMQIVSMPTFGQIFVTDTNLAHFDEIIANVAGDYRLWSVVDGVFSPIKPSK